MKVTKREQLLIGALLIALICYGFYNFIYIKQIQKISELETNKSTYSQKWEQAKAKIASKDKRNEQYNTLSAKVYNETNKLFPSIQQEEIIVILDKMIKDSNLQADLLGFSEISSDNASVDTNKTPKVEDKTKSDINEMDKLVSDFNDKPIKDSNSKKTSIDALKVVGAYKMQVTYNFKGNYTQFKSFIKQVEDYKKKIIINNVKLTGDKGSQVSGIIILDFYGVPKLNNNYEFNWQYKAPAGNVDPFVGSSTSLQSSDSIITNDAPISQGNSGVNNTGEIITKTPENKVIKSDFLMTAKPIVANLHTVTIEKAKDDSKQSYIYSDNKGIEPVEFYFSKVGVKYYYKYKTSTGTYPKEFSKAIEFVPNGENVILDIVSQKRGLGPDLSGTNIKITNDTDKIVVVNILDDDKNKPRVTILKEKGDISVVRNYINYSDK